MAEFNIAIQCSLANILGGYTEVKPMSFFEGDEAAMERVKAVELLE